MLMFSNSTSMIVREHFVYQCLVTVAGDESENSQITIFDIGPFLLLFQFVTLNLSVLQEIKCLFIYIGNMVYFIYFSLMTGKI